ncbi:hypothetical protein TPHA_0H02470 [Tetrapisispora phaffii CBS 4417]|uniref:Letm1 RBD domain-containing protein n=1 Tax=Tetrapisispora phaffii (strain ATCC 24235 / CBS 4417 / NBRC 1672 / NRRL Y-8282 / UCD 70-5) TaxID=1071381 RepID=G8BWJ9_TETPH|nr:hypothetical protein TPHA_0H02470 [Tetrapisispora phaffii CBS 4417]CCE64450.1 hypothetical protein TPHA_0H02470 [Tetrapisispora phaffii CBS 4417]
MLLCCSLTTTFHLCRTLDHHWLIALSSTITTMFSRGLATLSKNRIGIKSTAAVQLCLDNCIPYSTHNALLYNTLASTAVRNRYLGVRLYSTPPSTEQKKEKPPLMQRIKHEVKHYVNGTKLLGYEIKVSTKLLIKFSQGYELTRREQNQLKRTISDVFRLIPFSAFVIIPFAELLLPIALKIFPNLLPSTYESVTDKDQKRVKLLETRRKTSKFLHETLEESNLLNYNSIENVEKRKIFISFFKKLYNSKNDSSIKFEHEEIMTIANMFKNDTVLDNLSRPQLMAICKFMSITPFGNDNLLRYQIRYKLKSIMHDDIIIDYEGVKSLSPEELHQACVSRGIKAFGTSQEELTNTLSVWLHLRLKEKVPSVLMMLSSTYVYGGKSVEDISSKIIKKSPSSTKSAPVSDTTKSAATYNELLELYYEGILQVLSSIPDPVYNVAKLDVTESKSEAAEQKAAEKSQKNVQPSPTETAAPQTAKTSTPSKPSPAAAETTATPSGAKDTVSTKSGKKPEGVETVPELKTEAKLVTPKLANKDVKVVASAPTGSKTEEDPESADSSAFKLRVLKEQDELIKKEEDELRARKVREQIADDINLDDVEKEAVPPKTEQPKNNKKNECR